MKSRIAICGLLASLVPVVGHAQTLPGSDIQRLSLETAIRLALENNRQLQTARLEVDKAEADLAVARTRRLPSFETEATTSQLLTPVSFAFPQGAFGEFPGTGPIPATDTSVTVPRQPTASVSSTISQPLSQLFRIGLGVRMAATTRDIERLHVRSNELSTVNSVKRLYFSILQTESALAATEEAIALYRELDRTLQVRVAQKVALRSDALDVQYRLAEEELSLTTSGNTLASQKEQLNQLLGRDITTRFEVESVAAISVPELDLGTAHERAKASRPDVQEARLKLQQAELDRRLTKSDRVPEVSLALSYSSNFNIDVLPRNLASVGVRVTWEPFDWGRKQHDLAAKTHAVSQARLGVRDVEDRSTLEINSRHRTLTERRALLRVAEMAQIASREKLRVKTNQFQVQAALLPDVLQLRAELAGTDDRYQQALLAYWTAKADFEQALGEDVIP
jgi:outer membrane protein TolC